MAHVSKLSTEFVKNINDVVKLGDTLHVRVTKIDEMGRVDLTALTPEQEEQARQQQQSRPQFSPRNSRGGGQRHSGQRPNRPQRY